MLLPVPMAALTCRGIRSAARGAAEGLEPLALLVDAIVQARPPTTARLPLAGATACTPSASRACSWAVAV